MGNSTGSICTSESKFLLDNCVPPDWAAPLRKVGFPVLDGKNVTKLSSMPLDDDCLYLIYARHHGRILLTCDDLQSGGKGTSAHTGYRIAAELRQRGGNAISMGRPDQPVSRMLGKLLFYQGEWEAFFAKGSGKVRIGKIGAGRFCPDCGLQTEVTGDYSQRRPDELPRLEAVEAAQGQAYLEAMKQLGLGKRQPRGRPFQAKPIGVTLDLPLDYRKS